MDHPPPTWIPALIAATLATGIAGCGSVHTTTTRNATSMHLSVSAYEAQIVPKINHLVSVPQAPLGDARRPAKIKAYAIAARLDFGQAIKLMNSIKAQHIPAMQIPAEHSDGPASMLPRPSPFREPRYCRLRATPRSTLATPLS